MKKIILILLLILLVSCASVETKTFVYKAGQIESIEQTKQTAYLYDELKSNQEIIVGDVKIKREFKLGGTSLGTKSIMNTIGSFLGALGSIVAPIVSIFV